MATKKTDCEAINPQIVEKVSPKMPDTKVLYELSDFFKVMGDGTRIQLLWALDECEMCVGDLAVLLNMTKSAVSHQLRILRQSRLIKARRDGKEIIYSLDDNHVSQLFECALIHIKE